MTDELERLLEEAGEESEQVAQSLMFRAGYPMPSPGNPAAAERAGEEVAGRLGGAEALSMEGRSDADRLPEETVGDRSVRTLYRTLTRARHPVRVTRQSRESDHTPVVRRGTSGVESAREALWLDRIFQRDARRYDGGFTWQ